VLNLAGRAATITTNKVTIITLFIGRLHSITTIAAASGFLVVFVALVTSFNLAVVAAAIAVFSIAIIALLIAFTFSITTDNRVTGAEAFVVIVACIPRLNSAVGTATITINEVAIITLLSLLSFTLFIVIAITLYALVVAHTPSLVFKASVELLNDTLTAASITINEVAIITLLIIGDDAITTHTTLANGLLLPIRANSALEQIIALQLAC
jgi:hypothetical protein